MPPPAGGGFKTKHTRQITHFFLVIALSLSPKAFFLFNGTPSVGSQLNRPLNIPVNLSSGGAGRKGHFNRVKNGRFAGWCQGITAVYVKSVYIAAHQPGIFYNVPKAHRHRRKFIVNQQRHFCPVANLPA